VEKNDHRIFYLIPVT